VAVAAAGAAVAAPTPKPVCNLVQDAAGDVSAPPSDNLDIISADVATTSKRLTAVIRVKKLASSDGTSPTGVGYTMRFNVPGNAATYYLLASVEPDPIGTTTFEYGTVETGNQLTPIGDAYGVFDLAKSEVRITSPVDFKTVALKPGTIIKSLSVAAQRRYVVLLSGADTATSTKAYVAGSPSCVKVGK
jgi:hypothetical protein